MNRGTSVVGAFLVLLSGEIINLKEPVEIAGWFLMVLALASYVAMNFTASSTLYLSFRGKERDEVGYSRGDFWCDRPLYSSYFLGIIGKARVCNVGLWAWRILVKDSLRIGLSFGLTSAVITTLGLMVGLHSGTHSKVVVVAGILTIDIADAFSDALGIHISEESKNTNTAKHIWGVTLATFLAKFLFALTFAVPVLFLSLNIAIVASIVWGLTILALLSYVIARSQGERSLKIVGEHLMIGVVVIAVTHYVGDLIGRMGG